MSNAPSPLDSIQIMEPCSASWDKMSGDERARHCRACSLTVFNISAMTRDEAVALVQDTEQRVCARFYRRPDGTILTADCGKVRTQQKRRRTVLGLGVVASLFAVAFGAANREREVPSGHDWQNPSIVRKAVNPLRGVPVVGPLVNRIFPLPIITMGANAVRVPPASAPAPAPAPPQAPAVRMGEIFIPAANGGHIMGRVAPGRIAPPMPKDFPVS